MSPKVPRTSLVGTSYLNGITGSSVIFIGDMIEFKPLTSAIAVQREVPNFFGDEGDIKQFPIFSAQIPYPLPTGTAETEMNYETPYIRVGSVRILAVSTSALCHYGSNKVIHAESRIKHIRQLITGERTFL